MNQSQKPRCQHCDGSGIEVFTDKNGVQCARTCLCRLRERYEYTCRNAGFNLADTKTIDEYQRWNHATAKARMAAENYIRDFDIIRRQRQNWFVVFGQSGSGKTMLGRAIVKALIERSKPVGATAVKYYEMMQKLKSMSNDTDYWKILDGYTNCDLLFIDDLLKEKATYGELTEADIKHLFAVIDTRYDVQQPTIITTECTGQRLKALNSAIYYRMAERAYAEIIFDGNENNYRKKTLTFHEHGASPYKRT